MNIFIVLSLPISHVDFEILKYMVIGETIDNTKLRRLSQFGVRGNTSWPVAGA